MILRRRKSLAKKNFPDPSKFKIEDLQYVVTVSISDTPANSASKGHTNLPGQSKPPTSPTTNTGLPHTSLNITQQKLTQLEHVLQPHNISSKDIIVLSTPPQ